jgi:hypothetical protein
MPPPVEASLKNLGVTPWQLILAIGAVGFWFGEAKPRLDAVPKLTQAVAEIGDALTDIRVEVRVQGALLEAVQEIKTELTSVRKDLSNLEIRVASNRTDVINHNAN